MNATPALQAPAKPRLYRRTLTSTLHTRFIHAAALSLILSWDNAVFLHPKRGSLCPQANHRVAHLTQVDLIWSWFPLGPAGFKTALFFLTNLFVFTLLIATTEVGRPSYRSVFAQFRSVLLSKKALYTTAGYLASASWFAEAYIWSSSDLTWITKGNMTTADKLNERPIYLRSFFLMLGLAQAVQHLYLGRSNLHIPVAPPPTPQANDLRTHHITDSFTKIKAEVPWVLGRSALGSAIAAALGPVRIQPVPAPNHVASSSFFGKALVQPVKKQCKSNGVSTSTWYPASQHNCWLFPQCHLGDDHDPVSGMFSEAADKEGYPS